MPEYSERTLEGTPGRVTKLLCGMATDPMIRTVMEVEGGMTEADINEGRALLNAVLVAPRPRLLELDTPDAEEIRGLIVKLDAWDEPNFAIAKAALARHHPSAAEYVFGDLEPSRGTSAVTGIATFLSRVKALEEGTDPQRAATREEDRQAVELLARRKITAEVRAELQAAVDRVLGPTPILEARSSDGEVGERRAALVELRAWFDEWSVVARKVVSKRAQLIRLGLASRRSSTTASEGEPE